MSFGFGVGDFLAVIGLVTQIRKSFVGAPEQFKAISDDIRAFSIILQDVEVGYTEFDPEQSRKYQDVVTSCKYLLEQLNKILEKYAGVDEVGKSGTKKVIKRVWNKLKWDPKEIDDIRSQLSVKMNTLKNLNDQVINHSLQKLVRHQEETEREAGLKWISDINYVAQKNDIIGRCQKGSRQWLFESEAYLKWCKQKGGLLFCPGNPGSGKTYTTAMVIESLQLVNDANTLTAYLFCTYQNEDQKLGELLRSLLRVALEEAGHKDSEIATTCKGLRLSNKTISQEFCLNLLQRLFSEFTRVNLIVDAIDELKKEVRRPFSYDLLKLHEHGNVSLFVTSRGIPEIQHLFESCKMYTSLEVRSSDEDIRNFLRDNIRQLPSFVARSPKLQDEVIDSVTNASAGMFLLAELYLKPLASTVSVGSLRNKLSNLTTGSNAYDTLYGESMLRVTREESELGSAALQMLLILTCARRPLSPQELSHALSINESSEAFDEDMVPDIDYLIGACSGLVVLDDTSNIVRLVHKSVADYFERTRSHWFPRANEKMAIMCFKYRQIAETKPEETRSEQAPFFYYANANWLHHSKEAEKEAVTEAADDDAAQTNSATNRSPSSLELTVTRLAIHQMIKEVADVHSSIVEACHAGNQAWVEQLLVVHNYNENARGISQEMFISDDGTLKSDFPITPFKDNVLLTIAVTRGDYSMTEMLLARGADPNIFNLMGQTSLLIAATNGFDNLVSLLLDHRLIKPDLMCHYLGRLSTAFLVSIELGWEGCFGPLLERSNRRTRDSFNRGAMWLAATSGNIGIISELFKWPDVEIDYANTGFCGSPLTAAIRNEHEEAALLLLQNSKCRSCDVCGITPMHYAVRKGRHNLLKLLLEHDASAVDSDLYVYSRKKKTLQYRRILIDCERNGTKDTKTPFIAAIALQDAQAIELLLPYANANHGLTWRPLHQAAECGNIELFELLLQKENVEPDPVDEDGRTPFLLAAERGDCDIMKALIKKGGVQFDRRDAKGYAADHYIIKHFQNPDYFRVLASVLDIDVNEKDSAGSNLLHKACRLYPKASFRSRRSKIGDLYRAELLENNSGLLVAELLKRPRVDANLLDKERKTPLLLAVKNHQRDVVRLLLERQDTELLVKDENGNDALLLASVYEPMFRQLYPQASSVHHNLPPLRGRIPARYKGNHWPEVLDAEFKEYDESIFSMLIHDKRINPYIRNYKGESILLGVAMTGTKSMIQAVLETTKLASDLEIMLREGQNLLSIALEKNSDDDVVDLLIEHCPSAVLQKVDANGRAPLSYAVQRVTSRATRLLLEAGVDVNVVDRSGKTPLSYAVENRDSDAACRLIAVDSTQINFSDRDDLTILMYASDELNLNVMSALLERPDVDILALDSSGHSFLCHLMTPLCSKKFGDGFEDGSKKELDSVVHRIHHLLQLHVHVVKTYIHSPFTCAIERFKDSGFMRTLQHYPILSDDFHPGLDFSRCITRTGLLEILGEKEVPSSVDDYSLCIVALMRFANENT